MKVMTIRDIRQHWPEAERQLALEKEIIITRDGKPVARLLPMEDQAVKRKPFDPESHSSWMKQNFPEGLDCDFQKSLQKDREERQFF